MAIITQHKVTCPYCGRRKDIQIEAQALEHSRFVNCKDIYHYGEKGDGCGRMYVVQLVLLPRVQVYELTPAGSSAPIEDYDKRRDIEASAVQ